MESSQVRKGRLHRADGCSQNLGHLFVRAIVPVPQGHHRAVLGGKAEQQSLDVLPSLPCGEGVAGVYTHPFGGPLVVQRQDGPSAADAVHAVVGRDGEQPGPEGAGVVIPAQVAERPQKRLLSGVLCLHPFPQHPVGQIVDRRLVERDQPGKGLHIPVLSLLNPGRFVHHPLHYTSDWPKSRGQ